MSGGARCSRGEKDWESRRAIGKVKKKTKGGREKGREKRNPAHNGGVSIYRTRRGFVPEGGGQSHPLDRCHASLVLLNREIRKHPVMEIPSLNGVQNGVHKKKKEWSSTY